MCLLQRDQGAVKSGQEGSAISRQQKAFHQKKTSILKGCLPGKHDAGLTLDGHAVGSSKGICVSLQFNEKPIQEPIQHPTQTSTSTF
ncbi:hypothetical protein [Deinococcus roseus]|uniref:hypothetical protein n=1 Tax=Deinococcus roseus TaxID=392414 RepID=UPI001663FC22|nr:hypothetical protein [Deinococcus roseus]